MEYISIDIETTGLDREKDQVLEIGAIIENTLDPKPFAELPKFHAIIQHERYEGSAYAINMNQRIFKILSEIPKDKGGRDYALYVNRHNIVSINDVAVDFYYWCMENLINKPKDTQTPVTSIVAGKNYTDFDKQYLQKLPDWNKYFQFQRRVLDPTVLYTDFIGDTKLPDLNKCLERARIKDTVVTHDAVNDAWQVIQTLRPKYVEENYLGFKILIK